MAYNGRYSIALRILLLKQYLEANAGRNRYVKPQEIHDYLEEHDLDVEKKALYAARLRKLPQKKLKTQKLTKKIIKNYGSDGY